MKDKAIEFVAANDVSPVVYGAVIRDGGRGARYRLENGKVFTLSAEVCAKLPAGYPRWHNP